MQDKQLFKEFVEFCESQDDYKLINHSTWKTCAVGEFALTKGVIFQEGFLRCEENMHMEGGDKCKPYTAEEKLFMQKLIDDDLINIENYSVDNTLYDLLSTGHINFTHCNYYDDFTSILKEFL